ncbi:hypothetical protein BH11ARM1_BH11ARM1_10180 [soil metagenome]
MLRFTTHPMKQSGKASLVMIASIVAVVLVVALFAFSKESIASVGAKFMNALYSGNVKTLTDMTYLGNQSREDMEKQWDFAVNKAAPYYLFEYRIVAARQIDPNTASVTMQVTRDVLRSGAYAEKFELPLVRVDDGWKVDVRALSREMYPALPR